MDGTLDVADGRATVRFVHRLDHPPARVWQAIAEPEHLAAWFPQGVVYEGELAVGTRLRYSFDDEDDGSDEHGFSGEVEAVDPPTLLVVT